MRMKVFLAAALAVGLAAAWASAAPAELTVTQIGGPARVGEVCELGVDAPVEGGDPYDPASMALDAEIRTPGGKVLRVPGFYILPHKGVVQPPPRRVCRLLRVFLPTDRFAAGQKVAMLLDDVRLIDRETHQATVFDDFEGPKRWEPSDTQASLEADRPHGGKRALRVELTVPKERGWPGVNWNVPDADWDRVKEIRLWVMPLEGIGPGMPMIEFWTPGGEKFQGPLDLTGMKPGEWHEVAWEVPQPRPVMRFGVPGRAQWRLRFMPLAPGRHEATLTWTGPQGKRTGRLALTVADGKTDGFIRVSPKDPRYLAYASGRPCVLVGMNLIGQEVEYYRHYLDILARQKCNFIRLWLSPKSMGFELKPGRYDQSRAAQLDVLVDDCRRRGIHVMACITDYREVCAFDNSGYWKDSPYSAANGGPCAKAEDFFTSPAAAGLYRNKLRYLVARWGASPAVLAWEFFNEVDITDGWRKTPDAVRTWHEQMSAYLRGLDPWGHPVTSSFAGPADDALWGQAGMQIAQRHLYLTPGTPFAGPIAEGTRVLARHKKPVLVGEFGRAAQVSHAYDARGIGLHNGLWSSLMSGGCGTAMTWWWQWLDKYDQWRHFSAAAGFLEGVDFPAEGFGPLAGKAGAAVPPGEKLPPARLVSRNVSWKAAPYNQPQTLTLTPEGKLDRPELLGRLLHGTRNHPKLHNPITFAATFIRPGRFTVDVQEVSKYGGAVLEIHVDDKLALKKDFAYGDDPAQPTRPYAGPHGVDVAPGQHKIRVVCTGKDWINVQAYELEGVKMAPPLMLLGLRGRGTVLAWLWNETHFWGRMDKAWRPTRLADVRVDLEGLAPGTWRVRPYDAWEGKWGDPLAATVGADGKCRLTLPELSRDFAWRLERASP